MFTSWNAGLHALSTLAAAVEWRIAIALLLLAVGISPYYNVHWPNGGLPGAMVLLAAGGLLVYGVCRYSPKLPHWPGAVTSNKSWPLLLAGGVTVQTIVALLTAPVPISDQLQYLQLAQRLASGAGYVDSAGHLAFFPPGLPLALTPFVWLLGTGKATIIVANAVLYLVAAFALRSLARRLFDNSVAILTVLLFTLWPTRLLSIGLVSKENLTLAMVLFGTALSVSALHATANKRWLISVMAGMAYGLAALAQPGLLLLLPVTALANRFALRTGVRVFAVCMAIMSVTAALIVGSWMFRNYTVFEGAFSGVSTNGGSVFYRANNPLATGLWTAAGEVPIDHLPELEQNELGFRLGREWIRGHPVDMAKLSLRKVLHFLGDDNNGAYWGIWRGTGLDDAGARANSSSRALVYKLATIASTLFWVLLMALCAHTLLRNLRTGYPISERWLPLLYPFLQSACVFAVFESGARQHIAAVGPLFVLAAAAFYEQADVMSRASDARAA